MAKDKEKQIAFYMTQRSAKELDEIQKIFDEREGRVTKAYILNQAIYKYYEYVKEHYGINDEKVEK
ncbi:hypothetical protein [Sporosarcina sp. HYO08]|uniref:hypothetical protein n=1 Tax=Sporosarcina sp. HYO08 TaxID=1759557 RepID=UPI000791B866|nr:hypothetical protein [Sporosarcina sp. HYO08]KXH87541.1 hypothetical protein AU377_02960 [Sporosarcina sp. HYO08]